MTLHHKRQYSLDMLGNLRTEELLCSALIHEPNTAVLPIPKPNKSGTDPNSYRPISLLSTLGKLFERIIAVQLTSFFNRQHLLPQEQFAFRKKHSTFSQLARITDYISNGFNLHKHSGMELLDLEKAYDTVWIHGLLYKLIVF